MKGLAWITLSMLIAVAAWAAPEPSKAPRAWELDVEFHDLQRITVTVDGKPTSYWYLLYTVTNNAAEDVEFFPSFDLVTNELQVVPANDGIHPSVYDAIEARYRKTYPFFRNPMKVNGKLLQGADNARTSAAVFREFSAEANRLTIYGGGFSGEIVRMPNPTFDPNKPENDQNQRFFVLRKTLAIQYDVPGDPQTRLTSSATRRGMEWIMR
jgi:hypothetical protein